MKVLENTIYDFLNQFVDNELMPSSAVISDSFVQDKLVDISGESFILNCWRESTDKGDIVCVEVSRRKMLIFSEAYSLGVLFSDGVKTKISQEELWDIGF